jgi:hypothetical protein
MKMKTEGQIARGGVERESTVEEGPPSESLSKQHSLAKILGIWAAALPMGLLAWVIAPTIIPYTSRFTPVVVLERRLAR